MPPPESANVELMRRGFANFSRADWEATLAEIHPEIEWHLTFRLPDLSPDKTVFHGHEEVRELWVHLREAWDQLDLDLEQVLFDGEGAGGDGLLVLRVRFRAQSESSGIEVDRRLFYVQEIRDGMLLRQRPFDTEDEAFAAAGVPRG